jgi:hypothetical protein
LPQVAGLTAPPHHAMKVMVYGTQQQSIMHHASLPMHWRSFYVESSHYATRCRSDSEDGAFTPGCLLKNKHIYESKETFEKMPS